MVRVTSVVSIYYRRAFLPVFLASTKVYPFFILLMHRILHARWCISFKYFKKKILEISNYLEVDRWTFFCKILDNRIWILVQKQSNHVWSPLFRFFSQRSHEECIWWGWIVINTHSQSGVRVWVLALYMNIDKEMPRRMVAQPIWLLLFNEKYLFSLFIYVCMLVVLCRNRRGNALISSCNPRLILAVLIQLQTIL